MSELLQQIKAKAEYLQYEEGDTVLAVPLSDLETILEGMVLVPREPTDEMIGAACDEEHRPLPMWTRMKAIYKAMLAASPMSVEQIEAHPPPSAPVGVEAEPSPVRALLEAANAVLAENPSTDGMWTLEQAVRPFNATKPVECADGCPPQQVCDYCQIAALAQQPAAAGEEIMVNAAHDVYTLPLQPSGLSSGPRFVVHMPGPEQPAAHPAITHCDNCGCDWLDNGLNPIGCPYCKQNAWRAAYVAERATRYREGGMAIEQARIHAETDAARIAALAPGQRRQ